MLFGKALNMDSISREFVNTLAAMATMCVLLVQSTETKCSVQGSTVQGNSCFIASRFYTSWTEAYSFCSSLGCTLAAPDSGTKVSEIQEYAASVGLNTNLYLGGTDISSDGTFVKAGTGRPLGGLTWAAGEPNGDTQENCLMTQEVSDFLVSDSNCEVERRFICDCTELNTIVFQSL